MAGIEREISQYIDLEIHKNKKWLEQLNNLKKYLQLLYRAVLETFLYQGFQNKIVLKGTHV